VILVIDNYDSFTYNLVQYLGMCGAEVQVFRNDKIALDEMLVLNPQGIMMSPGPCTPKESGVCVDLTAWALRSDDYRAKPIPLFGVCLGHQALGMVGGAEVLRAKNVMHGKASSVEHDGKGLFEGMPNPFSAIRYHSLVVDSNAPPKDFIVTARSTDDHEIMGLRHVSLPIEGVQFHPESVLTESGLRIVENFVKMTN
jgi:anthranilate synthase/aminodeoxychorismate synthase-like glutamine amidotransferase